MTDLLLRAVHDLKNPLAVVRATLEWLELEMTDRPDALDAVRDATIASTRLVAIVDDLQLLARLSEPGAVIAVPVVVGELLAMAVGRTEPRLATRRNTVAIVEAPAADLQTVGDVELLLRALTALVEITARASRQGACIEVATSVVDGACHVAIGTRGDEPSDEPLDPLSASGLTVFVAARIAEVSGGSLQTLATSGAPRMVLRLPPPGEIAGEAAPPAAP